MVSRPQLKIKNRRTTAGREEGCLYLMMEAELVKRVVKAGGWRAEGPVARAGARVGARVEARGLLASAMLLTLRCVLNPKP